MTTDDKVLVGLTHADDEPENVLIAYPMGVEALRAGKEALMWLTKDGVNLAVDGFAAKVDVPGAPSIADLHAEYVASGGRFYACPVCVNLRGPHDSTGSTPPRSGARLRSTSTPPPGAGADLAHPVRRAGGGRSRRRCRSGIPEPAASRAAAVG